MSYEPFLHVIFVHRQVTGHHLLIPSRAACPVPSLTFPHAELYTIAKIDKHYEYIFVEMGV